MLEIEQDSENQQAEIKFLQTKIEDFKATKSHLPSGLPLDVKPDAYYEQKLKILEEDLFQLRKKLIEKERDNERLEMDLGRQVRKKDTKVRYIANELLEKMSRLCIIRI